jgi:hypothetical protein
MTAKRQTSMRSAPQAESRASARARTYSAKQNALQTEFIDAYGFDAKQISFDGDSLDPIFDFDALALLSIRLCDLPFVGVTFDKVDHALQMVSSTGRAVLKNENVREIFGSAFLGEVMHDGSTIDSWRQAVNVSRSRTLRTILRAVGFDAVAAHRSFKKTGNVVELQGSAKLTRDQERKEIHILAGELELITKLPAVGAAADKHSTAGVRTDRTQYEKTIATFFHGQTSSKRLTDSEHTQLLTILRAWARARAIASAA